MAVFEIALEPMLRHEGGYANDPNDHGGETYRGIARKYWGNWKGWTIIDNSKGAGFPKNLDTNDTLQSMVRDFYRQNFWLTPFNLLEDQNLANWLFDKCVNCGTVRPIKWLQQALNIPNDGQIGNQTVCAANAYQNRSELLEKCKGQARAFYTHLAEADPTQAKFLKGWLARV